MIARSANVTTNNFDMSKPFLNFRLLVLLTLQAEKFHKSIHYFKNTELIMV